MSEMESKSSSCVSDSYQDVATDSRIRLSVIEDKVFVWNAEGTRWSSRGDEPVICRCLDVMMLRKKHRIVGTLTGCMPRRARQNAQLSLPLGILPEEAHLLTMEGIAVLTDGTVPPKQPTVKEVEDFEASREKSFQEQVKLPWQIPYRAKSTVSFFQFSYSQERKIADAKKRMDEIINGMNRKRRISNEDDVTEDVPAKKSREEMEREVLQRVTSKPMERKHALIQIPTVSSRPRPPLPFSQWRFPRTELTRLRTAVYRALWRRGYWLTAGGKFGADFLVYPGDPCRFHSTYIAVCVMEDMQLTAQDVSAVGRLGSSVKKTVLLCSRAITNQIGDRERDRHEVSDPQNCDLGEVRDSEEDCDGEAALWSCDGFKVSFTALEWSDIT